LLFPFPHCPPSDKASHLEVISLMLARSNSQA
jgi:hypothetical protein